MKNIRENVGVSHIIEKMVENELGWFRHVNRRHVYYVVKRVNQMN